MVSNIFSRPQFNAQDFSKLLNAMDKPALLIEKHDHSIIAANRQAIELASYTQSELESLDARDLFGINKEKDRLYDFVDESYDITNIITRYNQRVSISAHAESLGTDSPWILVLFETEETIAQRQFEHDRREKILSYPKQISKALISDDPNISLSLALDAVHDYFPDGELAIYIGNARHPGLQKIVYQGKDSTFPAEIFPPDLNHFLKSFQWIKGQRSVLTLLHQRARAEGLKYFASVPINEEQSWIGIVIAGGRQDTLPENIQLRLNILAQAARESIKDGIITVAPDLTIESINPAAELTLGYASAEIVGHSIENILVGTDRLVPAISKAFEGVSTHNLGSINLHRRDGSAFPAHVAVYPITKNDIVISILLLLQDKSEREQARLRTLQLEQQAILGEVTSIFAHEVRNPINNISMGLQLIEQTFSAESPNLERVTRMQEDCQRLTDLMESVLAFSRTGTYSFNAIHVDQLIDRLLTRWRPRLKRVNITYKLGTNYY